MLLLIMLLTEKKNLFIRIKVNKILSNYIFSRTKTTERIEEEDENRNEIEKPAAEIRHNIDNIL